MWLRVTFLHSLGLPFWWEWTSWQLWFTIGGRTPSWFTPPLLIVSAEITSWRSVHFVDNTTLSDHLDPNYDRFVQWSLLSSKPVEWTIMVQLIDEAMITFKGRSSMKQYMPMKPTKHGFSVWVRATVENGYVCQLECYTGKQGSTVKFELRWSQDLLGPRRSARRCVYRQLF